MSSAASDCDVIDEALKRYKKIIVTDSKGVKHEGLPILQGLQVKVNSVYTCGYPKHDDTESCKYYSKKKKIKLMLTHSGNISFVYGFENSINSSKVFPLI